MKAESAVEKFKLFWAEAHMRAAHFRRLLHLRQKTLHMRVLEHCVLRLSNSKCL